jgi:hypothetical protein
MKKFSLIIGFILITTNAFSLPFMDEIESKIMTEMIISTLENEKIPKALAGFIMSYKKELIAQGASEKDAQELTIALIRSMPGQNITVRIED